jgi:hypothetical protein
VAPIQTPEEVTLDIHVPVLATKRDNQASLNLSPCDAMPGATLTGKKKRRRKLSKATSKVHSGSDQTAAGSTLDARRLFDVASDHNIGPEKPQFPGMPQLPSIPIESGRQCVTTVSTQLEKPVFSPELPLKFEISGHIHGLPPSNPALPFSPPAYQQQESSSSNISEQRQAKKTQRVTPPPGLENTTNEMVRYRTKFIGLLRDEESEHEKQLYRIT